jgi:transcriptional regulator with XRE-family HTH domain
VLVRVGGDVSEAALLGDTAPSGVPALDDAFGGIYWGDNVVWEVEEGSTVAPFYEAIAAAAAGYESATFVTLSRDPAEVAAQLPGVRVVDARPATAIHQPGALLEAIRRLCSGGGRDLILLDSLNAMARSWGSENALRFFTRTCPMLLELAAVAYWEFTPSAHPAAVRREIEEITQCVIAVGEGRLRINKAEGRRPGVQGTVFRLRFEGGRPELEPAPAAARLGAALLALRVNRGLSQSELARLAGVSPSAISQAERGQRGLSLETLLELTGRLGITLDELLRGEVAPGYRLARRHDPRERDPSRPLPLLDDPAAGLRAYLVRIPPRVSVSPQIVHTGVQLVAVGSGLVQVVLTTGRPVVREGETILVEHSRVTSWRNLGEREATLFWVLRDELGPIAPRAAPAGR